MFFNEVFINKDLKILLSPIVHELLTGGGQVIKKVSNKTLDKPNFRVWTRPL
jgi:hypothetical protein